MTIQNLNTKYKHHIERLVFNLNHWCVDKLDEDFLHEYTEALYTIDDGDHVPYWFCKEAVCGTLCIYTEDKDTEKGMVDFEWIMGAMFATDTKEPSNYDDYTGTVAYNNDDSLEEVLIERYTDRVKRFFGTDEGVQAIDFSILDEEIN